MSCGDGLKCASGQCTSRDQQCKTVMGQHLSNSTHSCYDTDCQLTCASPEFGPGTCFRMQQNFLDGTPCNGDGKCKAGVCNGSTTLGQVKSWINRVPLHPSPPPPSPEIKLTNIEQKHCNRRISRHRRFSALFPPLLHMELLPTQASRIEAHGRVPTSRPEMAQTA